MRIEREKYLKELLSLRGNGMIKTITGMRRSGKSFLLFDIFTSFLLQNGINQDHLILVNLEDYDNIKMRDPKVFYQYVKSKIKDSAMYYLLIDEIQMLGNFVDVLNGLLRRKNIDIYVTGSNARFLSKDVATEFRGRGFEVRIHPLSFSEYMTAFKGSPQKGLNEYMLYGGLPQILSFETDELKVRYLNSLFNETYITDIKNRYKILYDDDLEELISIIASVVGSFTNPNNLVNTFRSIKRSNISYELIKKYIDYLIDAFLIEKTSRYNIKGKKYVNSLYKYYFADLGLRNAQINFKQTDYGHLLENLIYNELRIRGFNVDVGVIPIVERNIDSRQQRTTLEVDFVCNLGSRRYYIQSTFSMQSEDVRRRERLSLRKVRDSFKKIIITQEECPITRDEFGITTMSIYDFLLKENSLEL